MRSQLFIKCLLALALILALAGAALSEQVVFVDFKHARLLHYYAENQQPDSYPIVLPRTEVQREMRLERPIHGRFTHADHQPTWWPTANMRRKDPTLPAAVRYGHPRHPIGIYRLRIDWQNPINPDFWSTIRIHGGARDDDLYADRSSGCIRMKDVDIIRVVRNIYRFGGEVRVTFMPPQFM